MGLDADISRKHFLVGSLFMSFAPFRVLAEQAQTKKITLDELKAAEKLVGIGLTDEQRRQTLQTLNGSREGLDSLRPKVYPNDVPLGFVFVPQGKKPQPGSKISVKTNAPETKIRPANEDDMAFLSVVELGHLIRTKQISAMQLTEMYIKRCKAYGPKLRNIITLAEETAIYEAKALDEELSKGKYRGPLHGIPYGLKDLFATKEYPTTWGAEPYRNQRIPYDAAVVETLRQAGAILIAKTSVGALAYGDLWFGGLTLNPWNSKQGSSGSSAGSAAGVAAGLFGFAIGTETLGSIISPAQRCRVTGLRPTFGRVSRFGAMALSWTMDKVGPLARTADDCAVVLAAIIGADERDSMSVSYPFSYRPSVDLRKLRIGALTTKGFDEDDVANEIGEAGLILKKLGAKLVPAKFSPPLAGVDEVLGIEAAAAFEEITRDGRVDTMKGSLWPPIFRGSSYLTGVDYIQAMRGRSLVMKTFEEEFSGFDVLIAPERAGDILVTTNLTGHPQIFIPMGTNKEGRPVGVTLVGKLHDEATITSVASMIQREARHYLKRPDLSKLA
jgi:Asp-tRNA(Asn)/Glu-tRNA(Gln) amidotransferase A subunit family amidase